MDKANRLQIGVQGLLPVLHKGLKQWKPPQASREKECREDLARFLREMLPDGTRIEQEYRHCGTTLDVFIRYAGLISRSDVFVELKKDLKRKTDFDRLVGQIESMMPGENRILIVLVGNTEAAWIARLKEKYARELGFNDDESTMAIAEVPVG